MKNIIDDLVDEVEFLKKERFSKLSFNGYKKIAVIVSPGTRGYYIKRGYHLGEKGYMYKSSWYKYFIDNLPYLLIIVAIGLTFYSAK